jgi:hypothetical protein
MAKADPNTIRFWKKHVEEYKASGLTREAYSKRKRIQVYQLDYWRKKLSRLSKTLETLPTDQWVPLQISDRSIEKDSHIDLWIGPMRIEVKRGFDSQILAEVLRTIGSGC